MTSIDWNAAPSKRERVLFVAFVGAIVFFLFATVMGPKQAEILGTRTNLEGLQIEKDALLKFMQVTPTVPFVTQKGKAGGTKLKVLMGEIEAPFQDLPSLLTRLTDPSFLGGVRLDGLSFSPTAPQAGLVKTSFVLQTSGSFSDTVKYIERLEEFPALFQVTDLIFSRREQAPVELQAEISCQFYERKGKTAQS